MDYFFAVKPFLDQSAPICVFTASTCSLSQFSCYTKAIGKQATLLNNLIREDRMKRIIAFVAMASFFIILSLHLQLSPAYAQTNAAATVDSLIAQSGYTFTKVNSNVWTINYTGKTLPKFKVVITTGDELVVMFVTLIRKDNFQLTSEAMYKILRANSRLDRIKASIDNDGDVSVRIDVSYRTLDLEEFKINVKQLAAASDETYGDLKQWVKTAQ